MDNTLPLTLTSDLHDAEICQWKYRVFRTVALKLLLHFVVDFFLLVVGVDKFCFFSSQLFKLSLDRVVLFVNGLLVTSRFGVYFFAQVFALGSLGLVLSLCSVELVLSKLGRVSVGCQVGEGIVSSLPGASCPR